MWQLLCGFADPGLESRYLAATFNSSATLDLFTAVYNVAMGVSCWFAAGAKHCTPPLQGVQHQQDQQLFGDSGSPAALAAAHLSGSCSWDAGVQGSWGLKMVWSVAAVLLLNAGSSLAVWLLRLQVTKAVKRQQQQQQTAGACSSSGEAQAAAGRAAANISALYARAGSIRQGLLALWILQLAVINVMCISGVVVAPGMVVRAWGLGGWAQNASLMVGLAVKAWMYHVRAHAVTAVSTPSNDC
jgi:hypothetical protein